MPSKRYVCVICPNSCEIEAGYSDKGGLNVRGNLCKKGEEYVRKELLSPERGLTATVLVKGGILPLASVKTSKPIPKKLMKQAAAEISKIEAEAPLKIGDVVLKNILNSGADVVVTKNVRKNRKYKPSKR